MKMNPVKSSNIKALGFEPTDEKRGTLHVQFNSGDTYEYKGVTHEEAADLAQAPSIGGHLSKHIKGKYEGRKV